MTAPYSSPTKISAYQARYDAQKIAFAPVVFHCVRIAWKWGLLDSLMAAGEQGLTVEALAERHERSSYAVKLVLETALSAQVVYRSQDRYHLNKTGHYIASDKLTQINFDFIHDVCYLGLNDLEASLTSGKPEGLTTLGDWSTVYEGLGVLPEPARSSWFAFDHYYSDSAFAECLPLVFERGPKRLMDIGANTGKWTLHCLRHDAAVQVTLVDLPIQINAALRNLADAGLAHRAVPHPMDILDESLGFPGEQDAIWMSQFLCCFGEDKVRSIFRRAATALANGGTLYVLDTFWDRQQYDVAAYCLINSSPYFTAIASGNSKMYETADYVNAAQAAGLKLERIHDHLGRAHSLLCFRKV